MLKSIFKPISDPLGPTYFQQKVIEDTDEIPEGWTDNLADIPEPDWNEDSISKPENVEVYPSARSVNISTE